jgi:uncharacterized membrane protein YgcG
MEYNSKREELVIPEYGRHIQNMIRYAKSIPDRNKRQQFIEKIVTLMMQMHPQNRSLEDYRDKMWKHVFHIAGYDLDATPPNGEIPKPEDKRKKPERVSYPEREAKFRHYGHNVQKLVAKAINMEDGTKKDGFVQVIGSYMKLAYKTWNREHYVSDDTILDDLESLSQGQLRMVEDASLDNLTRSNMMKRSSGGSGGRQQRSSGKPSSNNGRGGSGGGGGRQRHRRKK